MLSERFSGAGVEPVPAALPEVVKHFGKKILVVKPWQKSVHPLTAFSVSQLENRARTASILNFGDAFVAHSRNKCADVFLSTDLEWMLTIDDDMIVPFGDARWYRSNTGFNFPEPFASFNALDRLLSHGKTLVGALYTGRYPKSPPMYNEGPNAEESRYARSGPHNLIKPTKWVATGCMLIHRSVFEDIEKRFPRLARGADKKGGQWFTSTEASLLDRVERLKNSLTASMMTAESAYVALAGLEAAVAESRAENSLGFGEDVSFCVRAQSAGHTPYVDMGLVCGHIGHCVYGLHNTGLK